MEREKLEKWVESKIEKGRSPESLKEVLRRKGIDGSIVDEVVNRSKKEADKPEKKLSEDVPSEDRFKTSESFSDVSDNLNIHESHEKPVEKVSERNSFGLKNDFSSKIDLPGRKIGLILLAGLVLLLFSAAYSFSDMEISLFNSGEVSNYNSVEDVPDGFQIVFEDNSVEPVRAVIYQGEKAVFINHQEEDIVLDTGEDEFRISSGGYATEEFDSVTYYTAYSDHGETIQGSVALQ